MTSDEKEKVPSYDRFTIFNALLDAMNEKRRKKSRRERLLHRLGFSKKLEVIADTEQEFQDEQTSSMEASETDTQQPVSERDCLSQPQRRLL